MTSALRSLYASRGTIIPFSNNIDSSARFLYSKALLPNRSLRRRPLQAEEASADPKQSASRQQDIYKIARDALREAKQSARLEQDLGTRVKGIRKSSNRSDDENNVGVSKSDSGTRYVNVGRRSWDHCSDPETWDDDF